MNEEDKIRGEYEKELNKGQKKMFEFGPDDVQVTPDTAEVVLVNVEESEFVTPQGEKRKSLKAFFENAKFGLRFSEFFSMPGPNQKVSDRSKLGKFIKRYGRFGVGVKCMSVKGPMGYYKVVL